MGDNGRWPRDAEGRDWIDAATNQGLLRAASQHRKLEDRKGSS